MSEASDGVGLEVLPHARLPRADERVLAERRRLLTLGGRFAMWFLETLLVGPREIARENAHDVLASLDNEGTRAWALQTLYGLRLDPAALTARVVHTDRSDLGEEEWERHEIAADSVAEPDPVLAALDAVSTAQEELQAAEALRITAALTAWRAALAEEGAPSASNTPYQRGFFTDLAHRLTIASTTARTLVHTAADLEAVLPQVWAYFGHGRTTWRVMQIVHAELEGLDPAFHAAFDAGALRRIVEVAPAGLPDSLRRLRERLQAATADERHERAAARRSVRVEPAADGMAWLHAYPPAVDALAIDHQLTKAAVHAAGRADEDRGVGRLRADVLIDGLRQALRRPDRAADELVTARRGVEPRVAVLIPAMTALGHSQVPATLEGYGPIGIRTALRLAGEAKSWVRVLTDPFTGAVLDLARKRYRPNRDMRTLLRLLDGGTRGPSAPRPPGEAEVDHAVSFDQDDAGGDTAMENLALLSRRDHADETDHAGDYDLMLDRTALWHTPTGATIVTRPLDPLEPAPVPPELIDPEDCPF